MYVASFVKLTAIPSNVHSLSYLSSGSISLYSSVGRKCTQFPWFHSEGNFWCVTLLDSMMPHLT